MAFSSRVAGTFRWVVPADEVLSSSSSPITRSVVCRCIAAYISAYNLRFARGVTVTVLSRVIPRNTRPHSKQNVGMGTITTNHGCHADANDHVYRQDEQEKNERLPSSEHHAIEYVRSFLTTHASADVGRVGAFQIRGVPELAYQRRAGHDTPLGMRNAISGFSRSGRHNPQQNISLTYRLVNSFISFMLPSVLRPALPRAGLLSRP